MIAWERKSFTLRTYAGIAGILTLLFTGVMLTSLVALAADDKPLLLQRPVATPGTRTDLVMELRSEKATDYTYVTNDGKRRHVVSGSTTFRAPTTIIYGANDCSVLVYSGIEVRIEGGGIPVDLELKPDFISGTSIKKWCVKSGGATHMIVGKVFTFCYEYDSDTKDPLTFRVTPEGYEFLYGIGSVKDTGTGRTQKLHKPSQRAALFKACVAGDTQTVRRLLSEGADANSVAPSGRTPLMTLSETGNVEICRALLSHGAKIDTREWEQGATALMFAAKNGHEDMVKLLVEKGADLSIENRYRWTALHFAAMENQKGGGVDSEGCRRQGMNQCDRSEFGGHITVS